MVQCRGNYKSPEPLTVGAGVQAQVTISKAMRSICCAAWVFSAATRVTLVMLHARGVHRINRRRRVLLLVWCHFIPRLFVPTRPVGATPIAMHLVTTERVNAFDRIVVNVCISIQTASQATWVTFDVTPNTWVIVSVIVVVKCIPKAIGCASRLFRLCKADR
jgi:hypothetical protein